MGKTPTQNDTLVRAFIVLQIIGGSGFAFILLSAFIFRGAKRHPIWFSFCISWTVFALSYSLLTFAGQQFRQTPEFRLCVAQSALVYAAPPLAGCASFSLVLHLLLSIHSALRPGSPVKQKYPRTIIALVCIPWLVWTGIWVGFLVFAINNRQHVELSPNGTYCILAGTQMAKVTSVCATVAAVLIVVAQCLFIGYLLYRHRTIVDFFSQSVTMAVRVLIFTALGITAIVVGLVFVATSTRGVQYDILIAILPPSAALIFGTQVDPPRGWLFWRRDINRNRTGTMLSIDTVGSSSQSTISFTHSPITAAPRTPKKAPLQSFLPI